MSLWDDLNLSPPPVAIIDLVTESTQQKEDASTDSTDIYGKAPNTSADILEGQAEEGSSKRLLACNPCRERKVRCDRQQPICSRCARRGSGCTYSGPAKQGMTKQNLRRLLLNLQERLNYVENQGIHRPPQPVVDHQANGSHDVHISWPELNSLGLPPPARPEENMATPEYWQSLSTSTRQMDLNDSINVQAQPTISKSTLPFPSTSLPATTLNWLEMDASNNTDKLDGSLDSVLLPVPPLNPGHSAVALAQLHEVYFDIFDSTMPIINRDRFQAELVQSPNSMQVQALSQAMATLGALAAPELGFATDLSYARTRTLLEMCERQENGANLNSISLLQACVLLGFYELKQPNFARAWLTLGRGVRLAKILGFMGPQRHNPTSGEPRHRKTQPASLNTDAQGAEERRRTMWQLYILDAFAVMRTQWDPAFEEMTLPLPCPGRLADINDESVMPTISEAFESAEKHAMSTFAGMACVISMYRRAFNHIYASQQDDSYAFWDNYYRIDKLVAKCRACFLAQHAAPVSFSPKDPLSFVLFMNLSAVEVSLHKTAMSKAEHDNLNLSTEAESRCMQASVDITEALRACRVLESRDLNVFRQASALFTWATTMAAQAHLWMLGHGRGSSRTHVANLVVLVGVIREYISAEHVRSDLLTQIEAVLADQHTDPASTADKSQ